MVARGARHEAKLKNESTYYSANPCKRGHYALRLTRTGTCTECRRICEKERYPRVYKEKREYILNKNREYRLRNLEKDAEIKRRYYLKNKNKTLAYNRLYREQNREKDRAWKKAYKESKNNRMPKWLTEEHKSQINAFYKEALRLSVLNNIEYQVDHIIPLRGKIVSGLHVPWNLQILTKQENVQKQNKFKPEE